MPADAKLGLIVGVILVVALAVLFCTGEPAAAPGPDRAVQAAEVKLPVAGPSAAAMLPPPPMSRPVQAR